MLRLLLDGCLPASISYNVWSILTSREDLDIEDTDRPCLKVATLALQTFLSDLGIRGGGSSWSLSEHVLLFRGHQRKHASLDNAQSHLSAVVYVRAIRTAVPITHSVSRIGR